MKDSCPLISIIIPTYNRAALVLETLNSVLKQTYNNWECIVVDDGSTDETIHKLTKVISADHRFKVIVNKRTKGAPGSRNTGAQVAIGEYLIFLDSDDLLSADCLSSRIEKFRQHPGCDFLVFSTIEFKEVINDLNILINVVTTENVVERFLNMDVPWLTSGPIWRRDKFLSLAWKEELLSWQDWDLHIRALMNNYNFLFFSVVDNYHRCDFKIPAINSISTSERHLQSHLNLTSCLKELMRTNPRYLARLNGLIYWLAEKSVEQGFYQLSRIAIIKSHEDLHVAKKMINLLGLFAFRKLFIKHPRTPDFGTYRKILFES